jgi:uncharacterized membrane protein
MNGFLSLGRWLFALPFAMFGLLHLMNVEAMSTFVVPPYMPYKEAWVYFSGLCIIAATVSLIIGKYDKLAAALLAAFLLLLVIMVHVPATMVANTRETAMPQLLKDLSLAGACMMYALNYAKDKTFIG